MLDWAKTIKESAVYPTPDTPGFPASHIQERFVGRSGRAAIEEVIPFAEIVNDSARLSSTSKVLDFGVGWGRIARLFQKTVCPDNLYLADVDPEALALCKENRVQGRTILLDPTGSLPFANASLNAVYSYSVFSHLSEASAKHWLHEISRTLSKGGLFAFTTQSLRFLELVVACHNKPDANDIERSVGKYMGASPENAATNFRAGKHAYSDVNGQGGGGVLSGDFYGWAAIPSNWFTSHFGADFKIIDYIDDPSRFEQAVFVTKRK